MDYDVLSTIVTFGACETRQCVSTTIVNDGVLENVESFLVNLERTPGLESRITLNPIRAEVQIIDNNGLLLYCLYNNGAVKWKNSKNPS